MENFSLNLQTKIKAKYSPNSIRALVKAVKWAYNLLNKDPANFNILHLNTKKFITAVEKSTAKKSSIDSYLGYIKILFKLTDTEPSKYFKEYYDNAKKEMKNIHAAKKMDKLDEIDMNDLYEYVTEQLANKQSFKNYQRYALVSLLKTIPFRFTELTHLRWMSHDKDNYVDLSGESIVIQQHKAKKSMGSKFHDLPLQQVNDLLAYYKAFNFDGTTDYVFVKNIKNKHVSATDNGIAMTFKRLLTDYQKDKNLPVKSIGIHKLRHNHFTKKAKDIGITADMVKKLLALKDEMGHSSLETSLMHYLKTIEE